MKLYLAGPMRGVPEFNFPLFRSAAEELRAAGYFVFSPAEQHPPNFGADNPTGDETKAYGFSRRQAIGADLAWICEFAEGIAMLPGWHKSKGASAEVMVGQALGLRTAFWMAFL